MGQIVSRESSAIRQRKYSVKVLLDKILHEDDEGVANTPILPPTPRNIKGNPEIFGSHQKSPRSPNGMDKKKRTDESKLVHEMWRIRNTPIDRLDSYDRYRR